MADANNYTPVPIRELAPLVAALIVKESLNGLDIGSSTINGQPVIDYSKVIDDAVNKVLENVEAVNTTAINVAADADRTNTAAASAQQAVAGVTADANSAKVLLTAAMNGESPLTYRGYWDANANSPALSSGAGTDGDLYIVSVAGATDLDGNAQWSVGDGAWFTNGKWLYFSKASWAAVARTITALTRVNIGGTGAGIGAHAGGWRWALVDEQGFIGGGLDVDGNYRFASAAADIGPVRVLSGVIRMGCW